MSVYHGLKVYSFFIVNGATPPESLGTKFFYRDQNYNKPLNGEFSFKNNQLRINYHYFAL